MDMTGEFHIPAPRDTVWKALNDPEILKRSIAGCEELEKTSDTEFTAKVTAKVGPVKARFTGKVTLSDLDPPNGYKITGEGQGGAAGFAKGSAEVHLEPEGDGHAAEICRPCGDRRQAGADRRPADRRRRQQDGRTSSSPALPAMSSAPSPRPPRRQRKRRRATGRCARPRPVSRARAPADTAAPSRGPSALGLGRRAHCHRHRFAALLRPIGTRDSKDRCSAQDRG